MPHEPRGLGMGSRAFLFVLGAVFAGSAVAGLLLLRVAPAQTSIGAIVMATAFAIALAYMGWKQPQIVASACNACGQPRDASLAFCVRCGRAHA